MLREEFERLLLNRLIILESELQGVISRKIRLSNYSLFFLTIIGKIFSTKGNYDILFTNNNKHRLFQTISLMTTIMIIKNKPYGKLTYIRLLI